MNNNRKHPCQRDLLLAADGELSRRRLKTVEAHLKSCWSCRVLMHNIEDTIAAFVSAREVAREQHISPSSPTRALLVARIRSTADENKDALRWWVWLPGGLKFSQAKLILTPLLLLAIVSVGLSLAWIRRRSHVTADEFLRRLALQSAATTVSSEPAVICQRVVIHTGKRTVEKDVYLDAQGRRHAKVTATTADKPLEAKLAIAGVSWENPLSGGTYLGWHDRQEIARDDVRRDGDFLILDTTVSRGVVRHEALKVRENDFHPVGRTVEFRDQDRVEISELNYAVLDWKAVDESVFDRPDPFGPANTEKPLRLVRLVTKAELDMAELEARLVLNRLHADTSERVELVRTATGLEIRGVVETVERKRELEAQLRPLPNTKLFLATFEEMDRHPVPVTTVTTVGSPSSPVTDDGPPLEKYLLERGRSREEVSSLLQQLVESSVAVRQESRALADLSDRFNNNVYRSQKAAAVLAELRSRHTAALVDALRKQQMLIKETGMVVQPEASGDAARVGSLRETADENGNLCQALASGTSVRNVQVESIAAGLENSIERLKSIASHLTDGALRTTTFPPQDSPERR
jgi:hypothetical protein